MARSRWFESCGAASRFLGIAGALGFALLGARFVVIVGTTVVDYWPTRPTTIEEETPVDRRRSPLRLAPSAAPTSSEAPATSAAPTGSPKPAAHSTTSTGTRAAPEMRTLVVDVGPPRSRVYVNGRSVGQTPFAGQWSCAVGEVLLIQIIPERGAPLERHAVCKGATMSASGD